MKTLLFTLLFALIGCIGFAQNRQDIDSLKQKARNAISDSARFRAYMPVYIFYQQSDIDSASYYAEKLYQLAKKNKQELALVQTLNLKGFQLYTRGRYAESLQCLLEAIKIAENEQYQKGNWAWGKNWNRFRFEKRRMTLLASSHQTLSNLMLNTLNLEQAQAHAIKAKNFADRSDSVGYILGSTKFSLAKIYTQLNKLDSALILVNAAEHYLKKMDFNFFLSTSYHVKGTIFLAQGDTSLAKQTYFEGITAGIVSNNLSSLARNYFSLTALYLSAGEKDSSLYFALKSVETIKKYKRNSVELNLGIAYEYLYLSYKLKNQKDSTFKYQELTLITKEKFYNERINNLASFQNYLFSEQLRLQVLEKEKEALQNKIRTYSLLTALAVFLLISYILYRNNLREKKAKALLHEQKEKVEITLSQLKSTQAQLIQKEKLASLGELTAGIAHEIQNPLNFVNNFSELSVDLISELKEERSKEHGKRDEELENDLLNDLAQNQEKINLHGKRASSIVKGMLEHSRTSTGERQLTDINQLAEEYLRLSYHGLRAKDSSFNCDYELIADKNLPKIEVVPQEIGRVLLNLLNNAFYAVHERAKHREASYQPKVKVTTKVADNQVQIRVTDNGLGILENIKAKIFQPFFTTKPTGEGTGLGLSLSYDIVTKGHGGTMTVESCEGTGTDLFIQLPF